MQVIVIGGGIAGLAAAHRLALSGARVTVVEAGDR
ncbi:FAD-dependent oxidoreductase, partial [Streptomyces sp. NPDC059853]